MLGAAFRGGVNGVSWVCTFLVGWIAESGGWGVQCTGYKGAGSPKGLAAAADARPQIAKKFSPIKNLCNDPSHFCTIPISGRHRDD